MTARPRLWRIYRKEQPIKGRRKQVVFCASIRATLPEAREQVMALNRVYSADGLFGRNLNAWHFAYPTRAAR